MAFDFKTVMGVIKTHLESVVDAEGVAVFTEVNIGRPTGVQPEGPSARIVAEPASVVDSVLNATVERHVASVRIYRAQYTDGAEARELDMVDITERFKDKLYGDFTLGGGCRNIDLMGQYGSGLTWAFVEEEVAESPYHIATIEIPLIVDPTTLLVA